MRRSLFDQVKVQPYEAGDVIDREGALSLVLGVKSTEVTGTPMIDLTIETSDSPDGDFAVLTDGLAILTALPFALAENGEMMFKIDVIACKRYVKVTPVITGTATCAYAIAVGDLVHNPPR